MMEIDSESIPVNSSPLEFDSNNPLVKERWGWIGGLLVFLLALPLLWYHAAPGATFHDSGEFALSADSFGLPHPPGAPTWSISASLFLLIGQFGEPARGTNMHSGFYGAISLGLLFCYLYLASISMFPRTPLVQRLLGCLAGPLVLLHSAAFLEQSFTSEQYTLMATLLSGVLITTYYAGKSGRSGTRKLVLLPITILGLLIGLSIGNHVSQICLFPIPAILILRAWREGWRAAVLRSIYFLAGLLTGLSVFLYLFWVGSRQPIMDWVKVDSWERFMWAIQRKLFTRREWSEAPDHFVREWLLTYNFIGELGVIGFMLAVAGLAIALLRHKIQTLYLAFISVPFAVGLLLGHLGQNQMDVKYIRHYGVSDWHLPLYLVGASLAAVAFSTTLRRLQERNAGIALASGITGVILLSVFTGVSVHNSSMRNFSAADLYLKTVMAPLNPNSVLFLRSDNPSNLLAYHRYKSGSTDKRMTVLYAGITQPPGNYRKSAPPPTRGDYRKYLDDVISYQNQPIQLSPKDKNISYDGPYYGDWVSSDWSVSNHMLPRGFFFEFVSERPTTASIKAADMEWRATFPDDHIRPGKKTHRLEREAWANLYWQRAAFLHQHALPREAIYEYHRSLEWQPINAGAWAGIAVASEALDLPQEAHQAYLNSIQQEPWMALRYYQLARFLKLYSRNDEALKFLEQAIKIDPNHQLRTDTEPYVRGIQPGVPQTTSTATLLEDKLP